MKEKMEVLNDLNMLESQYADAVEASEEFYDPDHSDDCELYLSSERERINREVQQLLDWFDPERELFVWNGNQWEFAPVIGLL